MLEPEDQAEKRRLAAAVRSGDGHELAAFDGEIHVAEDRRAGAIGERDVVELDR
jgi:hypothetical protein